VCLTIFFVFFIRHTDDDKEAAEHISDEDLGLPNDEDYLHSMKVCSLFLLPLLPMILLTEQFAVH
jgi:hypothetical protein